MCPRLVCEAEVFLKLTKGKNIFPIERDFLLKLKTLAHLEGFFVLPCIHPGAAVRWTRAV